MLSCRVIPESRNPESVVSLIVIPECRNPESVVCLLFFSVILNLFQDPVCVTSHPEVFLLGIYFIF